MKQCTNRLVKRSHPKTTTTNTETTNVTSNCPLLPESITCNACSERHDAMEGSALPWTSNTDDSQGTSYCKSVFCAWFNMLNASDRLNKARSHETRLHWLHESHYKLLISKFTWVPRFDPCLKWVETQLRNERRDGLGSVFQGCQENKSHNETGQQGVPELDFFNSRVLYCGCHTC